MMLILLSTVIYAEGNTLTVQDAVKLVTENSLEVMKYTNAVRRYQRDYVDSLASSRQMKDMLELDARFKKLSRKGSSRTPAEDFEYEMLSRFMSRYMSASERLDMTIASELTPNQMEYMLNVNKALLKSTKENIYLTVYKSFNNITKAEDAIKVKSALIANLESNYKAAAAKYAQGKLSNNSMKTMELELQKAKVELNILQIEKKKAVIELNKLLGNPLEEQYSEYINEAVPENIEIKTLQEYIDIAYENNNDFKTAKQALDIAKEKYELTTSLYAYETNVNNMNAYIEYNNAKNQFDAVDIGLQLQVRNGFNGFQNQLANLKTSRISQELQESKLKEIRSRYDLGLSTELEVSEAYISYFESQLNYLSATRDTWLAKLNLDLVCGTANNNN